MEDKGEERREEKRRDRENKGPARRDYSEELDETQQERNPMKREEGGSTLERETIKKFLIYTIL